MSARQTVVVLVVAKVKSLIAGIVYFALNHIVTESAYMYTHKMIWSAT